MGWGIYNEDSSVDVINCLFYDNDANNGGGASNTAYVDASNVKFENCTFSNNYAIMYGGGIHSAFSDLETEIVNTILYGNTADEDGPDVYAGNTDITMSYSDIDVYLASGTGSYTTSNLIDTDPLFADSANDDYHLKSSAGRWNGSSWVTTDSVDSPCIDAGDNSSYSNETEDNGDNINMGYYGNTAEASRSN